MRIPGNNIQVAISVPIDDVGYYQRPTEQLSRYLLDFTHGFESEVIRDSPIVIHAPFAGSQKVQIGRVSRRVSDDISPRFGVAKGDTVFIYEGHFFARTVFIDWQEI